MAGGADEIRHVRLPARGSRVGGVLRNERAVHDGRGGKPLDFLFGHCPEERAEQLIGRQRAQRGKIAAARVTHHLLPEAVGSLGRFHPAEFADAAIMLEDGNTTELRDSFTAFLSSIMAASATQEVIS